MGSSHSLTAELMHVVRCLWVKPIVNLFDRYGDCQFRVASFICRHISRTQRGVDRANPLSSPLLEFWAKSIGIFLEYGHPRCLEALHTFPPPFFLVMLQNHIHSRDTRALRRPPDSLRRSRSSQCVPELCVVWKKSLDCWLCQHLLSGFRGAEAEVCSTV